MNKLTNVIIICKIHGKFTQQPRAHIHERQGCPLCGGSNPLNTEIFISMSRKIHNNTYNYELVNYKNYNTKVIIICNKHGEFNQAPAGHLQGRGCSKCGDNISKQETLWLNSLNIPKENRNVTLKIENKIFNVDDIDYDTNTVYEFNGDFWHGNPNKFKPEDINSTNKISFGELYRKTLDKEQKLIKAGYKVVSIWESDWKKQNE